MEGSLRRIMIQGAVVMAVLILLMAGNALSAPPIEEDADMVFSSDRLVTGEMNSYSEGQIVVNTTRYALCGDVKLFNSAHQTVRPDNLDTALDVKLFIDGSRGCVRKIKVLKYGE